MGVRKRHKLEMCGRLGWHGSCCWNWATNAGYQNEGVLAIILKELEKSRSLPTLREYRSSPPPMRPWRTMHQTDLDIGRSFDRLNRSEEYKARALGRGLN